MHVHYMLHAPLYTTAGTRARSGQEKESVCMGLLNVHLQRGFQLPQEDLQH